MADGRVDLQATGGNLSYTYSSDGISFGASSSFSGLLAGTYVFTIRDARNCEDTIHVRVFEPALLQISNQLVTNASCFSFCNGSVDVTAVGGTVPYTYSTDGLAFQNASLLSSLCAGNYVITLRDVNGCEANAPLQITEPTDLITTLVNTVIPTCFGGNDGSLEVAASGGTGPYTFSLDSRAFVSGPIISGVSGGPHQLRSRDAAGCEDTIQITVAEPVQTTFLDTAVTSVSCFSGSDGAIDLIITGTVTPYSISWSSGQITEDLLNLSSGFYLPEVTDGNGCEIPGIDSVFVPQPSTLVLTDSVRTISCNGAADGCIFATASGSNGAFVFSWSNPGASTPNCNLNAGSYSLTVSDALGCSVTRSYNVSEPATLAVSVLETDITCPGYNDGSLSATPSGGTAPYSYQWNVAGNLSSISSLTPGSYSVTVTDQNGCTAEATNLELIELPGFDIDSVVTDKLCDPLNNGAISINVLTPGTYTYAWSDGVSSEDRTGLSEGVYGLTINSSSGCVLSYSFEVVNRDIFNASVSPGDTTVRLGNQVQLLASGTTNIANVIWSPQIGLSCNECNPTVVTAPSTLEYRAVITDENGCVEFDTVRITVQALYDFFLPNAFTPNSDGNNDFWEAFGDKSGWAQVNVQVFNRAGEKVFESRDPNFAWDGTYKGEAAPSGVYVYTMKLTFINSHVEKDFKGSITLFK